MLPGGRRNVGAADQPGGFLQALGIVEFENPGQGPAVFYLFDNLIMMVRMGYPIPEMMMVMLMALLLFMLVQEQIGILVMKTSGL